MRSNVVNSEWGKHFTTPFTFDVNAHNEAGVHYDLTKVESIKSCGYDGVISHTCVVCDRVENDIDPATGNHTLNNASVCADKCEVCLKYIQKESQSHSIIEKIEYLSGYGVAGAHNKKCSNEGCSYDVTETAEVIFDFLGFSTPVNGDVGMVITFKVNKNAISELKRVENIELTYGVYAAAKERLQDNDILNADGSPSDYVVKAEIDSLYASYDFKLTGFNTEAQKATLIALGTYVIDNNGKITYIQIGEPMENEKYFFISFDSVSNNKIN